MLVGGTHPNVHVQAFEVTVVSARDTQNERWIESAKETEGVDVDSVFQRFPHGVKIMLQEPEPYSPGPGPGPSPSPNPNPNPNPSPTPSPTPSPSPNPHQA